MKQKKISVVETKTYVSRLLNLLAKGQNETELRKGIKKLIGSNPMIGDVIPRTGGVRKLRYAVPGKGKRGGYRVIYYFYDDNHPIFLLTIYAKSSIDNLTSDDEKLFAKFVRELKVKLGEIQ